MTPVLVDRVAVVHGPAALALSRLLLRPEVQSELLASPPWLATSELATAVAAIHEAGAAYEAELRRSETKPGEIARRSSRVGERADPARRWSVDRAARELGVTPRRIQQLAATRQLDAEIVRGRWEIDPVSVARYSQVREGAA